MLQYKVRPWRDQAEILSVRSNLFLPNIEANIASRRDACNTIEIWRRRLPLPHAISSSSLIAEAQLHHLQHGTSASSMSMRALYAAALARFVTGFCDINQSAAVKRSMFDVAAGLGISERWVELRHQITHGGELPPLAILEEACNGAMGWLWEAFWSRLDFNDAENDSATKRKAHSQKEQLNDEMRLVLKRFVAARKLEVESKGPGVPASTSVVVQESMHGILQWTASSEDGVEVLLLLLVDETFLVPAKRAMQDTMAGAFLLWDQLLIGLSERIHGFLVRLTLRLLAALTNCTDIDESQDPTMEALESWLEHIFTSKAWKPRRHRSQDGGRDLRHEVLTECAIAPAHWTSKLSLRLLSSSGPETGEESTWRDINEAATLLEGASDVGEAQSTETQSGDVDLRTLKPKPGSMQSTTPGRWAPYPGRWRPLPIGMPQSAVGV